MAIEDEKNPTDQRSSLASHMKKRKDVEQTTDTSFNRVFSIASFLVTLFRIADI